MIKDLAIYEKAPNEVVATEELLNAALFGPQPHAFAHVVEVDNRVIGIGNLVFEFFYVARHSWNLSRRSIH